MNREDLYRQIQAKKTMLCVGLDVDYGKMPEHIKGLATSEIAIKGQLFGGKARSIIEFNKAVIDATAPYCIAYKPNLAFYECYGSEGVRALEATVDYIRTTYPGIFLIADAKRGDIGNTAKMYARAFFEFMDFDAVTLSPYMGQDSILPFLEYKDKWAIVLALTSNASAEQFQMAEKEGKPRYNMMFVVGATRAEKLVEIRSFCPDNFLLVPGVGAQGGSAEEVIRYGANSKGGLLINSSRGILYADSTVNFAKAAARVASETATIASI